MIEEKTCIRCGRYKPLTRFCFNEKLNNHSEMCRSCLAETTAGKGKNYNPDSRYWQRSADEQMAAVVVAHFHRKGIPKHQIPEGLYDLKLRQLKLNKEINLWISEVLKQIEKSENGI
jgi:hypothetical protein